LKIVYTLHAIERLHQRGIMKAQVEACIREPDKVEELEGAYRCVKRMNDQALVVIFKKVGNEIVIITAFKTSKTRKYLP
jgi:hypothetical protein